MIWAAENFAYLDDERRISKADFISLLKIIIGMVYFSPLLEVTEEILATYSDDEDEEDEEDEEEEDEEMN